MAKKLKIGGLAGILADLAVTPSLGERAAHELVCGELSGLGEHGEEFIQMGSSTAELREEEDCFLLIEKDWMESEGITSETPVCTVTVCMLQALIEWITGYEYEIEEIQCRAMGHSADVFRISKVPNWKEN